MEPLKILYEDAHLVICCKPVGVLSEDSESGRCMPQLLREHYLAQGQKNPYIATVHRLDKITGGVMVFSRRREVTGKLTAAMQAHELVKEYLAVLRGHPQESAATLTDLLFRDAGAQQELCGEASPEGHPGGQPGIPGAVPDGGAVSGAGAAAHRTHPPDPGAVFLPGAAAAGGYPIRQQGPQLHGGPVVLPPGLPPSGHRQSGGRVLPAAPGIPLGSVSGGGGLTEKRTNGMEDFYGLYGG